MRAGPNECTSSMKGFVRSGACFRPAADFRPAHASCRNREQERAFWRRWAASQCPAPDSAVPHCRGKVPPASRWAGSRLCRGGHRFPTRVCPGQIWASHQAAGHPTPGIPNPAQERLAIGREIRKRHTGRIHLVEIVPSTNGVTRRPPSQTGRARWPGGTELPFDAHEVRKPGHERMIGVLEPISAPRLDFPDQSRICFWTGSRFSASMLSAWRLRSAGLTARIVI